MPTCQICAREIKDKTGVIAHHGYRRPGAGWQTSSCAGARHLAYELSCDAIPTYIANMQRFLEGRQAAFKKVMDEPPATLVGGLFGKPITYTLPAGFNPAENLARGAYTARTYHCEHANLARGLQQDIKYANDEITRMEARLAAWVAPNA